MLKSFIDLIRPSITIRTGEPRKALRRTAWLDGLRGFAAFLVYWQHHQLWAHGGLLSGIVFENAFGYEGRYYFAALPGVRTFFTGGHYSVTIFFVISGYVLSTKPLSLIHAGDQLKLSENLASALFRRWLRLFIPVICTTFLYMASWHVFGLWTSYPLHEKNLRDEMWMWYAEFKNFSFVFRAGGDPWFTYNFHAWSIPVEFKGSIVVFTFLQALSRSTRKARLWSEVGLMFYFMYIVDGWYCCMFMAGLFLSDLDLLAVANDLPHFFLKFEPYKEFIYYNLFFIAIYLGGVPSHSSDMKVLEASRGWYYLSFLKPQAVYDPKWFYLFWASLFTVSSVPRIWWLKAFFETRFCLYMGRISYAFYLMHGPILWIVGDRLYCAVGFFQEAHLTALPTWVNYFPLSKSGPLGMEWAFLLPHLILLPLTLWASEVVTKLFDTPSVKFSQWAYGITLAPSEKS
jgi:peptidoglycan/LPS O-acetylase OafA/YrhL